MEPIELALEDLRSQECPNFKSTAIKYGVDRTRLGRRFKGQTISKQEYWEIRSHLNNEQTKALIIKINRLSAFGTPPTPAMVRVFAFNLLGKLPGENWAAR